MNSHAIFFGQRNWCNNDIIGTANSLIHRLSNDTHIAVYLAFLFSTCGMQCCISCYQNIFLWIFSNLLEGAWRRYMGCRCPLMQSNAFRTFFFMRLWFSSIWDELCVKIWNTLTFQIKTAQKRYTTLKEHLNYRMLNVNIHGPYSTGNS